MTGVQTCALPIYFYKWTDCDENINRWLIFKVTTSDIYSYLYKRINLRKLILKNPFVYLIDLNDSLEYQKIILAAVNNLPEDYFPSENSFFISKHFETYATDLKEKLTSKYDYDFIDNISTELKFLKQQQNDNKQLLEIMFSMLFGYSERKEKSYLHSIDKQVDVNTKFNYYEDFKNKEKLITDLAYTNKKYYG